MRTCEFGITWFKGYMMLLPVQQCRIIDDPMTSHGRLQAVAGLPGNWQPIIARPFAFSIIFFRKALLLSLSSFF